jgi:hypothetical protein
VINDDTKNEGSTAVAVSAGKGSGEVSQHTRGPWTLTKHFGDTWFIYGRETFPGANDGRTICLVSTKRDEREDIGGGYQVVYRHIPTADADARLIAASPELVEALRDLVGLLAGDNYDGGSDWNAAMDERLSKVRAALSKTGG